MRFVVLALTILLGAGCQAHFVLSYMSYQYEHIRFTIVNYLGHLKETAQKTIDSLDDNEFKTVKKRLNLSLDRIQGYMEAASETLVPLRFYAGPQIVFYISHISEQVEADINELRKELEPKCEELRQVLKKHFGEYREKLEPLIKEYLENNRELMEQLWGKLGPAIKQMEEKIKTNVEETKSKLTPIIEVLSNKLLKRLEQMREQLAPYVEEYREQAKSGIEDVWQEYESGDLQIRLQIVWEQLRPQLEGIFATINRAFQKE